MIEKYVNTFGAILAWAGAKILREEKSRKKTGQFGLRR
jgi:hypothetical protein